MVRNSPWVIAGIALSVAMVAAAPFAWRRLGARRGLRWLAIAIVPAGLAMSGLAAMFGRIGVAIGRFFTSFVFSPWVWVGFALLGGAVALEFASRAMRTRGIGEGPAGTKEADSTPGVSGGRPQVERSRSVPASNRAPADDDMADIEELLKRRGIN